MDTGLIPVDLLLVNGRVWCGDEARSTAAGVAVRGGRIAALLAAGDVPPAARAVVDLGGRFVMPGLHDMHTHPDLALAPRYSDDLHIVEEDPTPAQVARAIVDWAGEHPERPWVYGQAFVHFTFRREQLAMGRAWLDQVLPDRPVAIHDRSWGCLAVNSAALAAAGIDRHTPDPGNGYIERDPVSGEPTGILVDGAYSLVYRVMPPPPAEALERAYADAAHYQASRGVTAAKYLHVCEHRLDALRRIDRAGRLTLRVEAAISWQDDIFPVRRRWELLAGERHHYRSAHLSADAVKFHFDGTHEARSSWLADPEAAGGDPDARWQGHLNMTAEHLRSMVVDLDRRGIRVIAHCTGDGASALFLDAVAAARRANGHSGVRHQCAHSTLLLDESLARFAELDVTAEFSPVGWQPTPFAYARRDAFGEQRMARAYNVAGVLAAGGHAVMGTDWPVSHINPWLGLEALMTRQDPLRRHAGTFYGAPLGREEALEVLTRHGAWSMGLDHLTGSLEPGKSADLVVLDRDPLAVDLPGGLHDTQVLLTLLEGRPTWDPGGLLAGAGLDPVWQSPAPAF